jgi:hypothetical protein
MTSSSNEADSSSPALTQRMLDEGMVNSVTDRRSRARFAFDCRGEDRAADSRITTTAL